MPVILVDRLPLPSLKTYTVISVALLSCSVYYAVQVTSDVSWKANATASHEAMATSAMGKLGESSFNPSQPISTREAISPQAAPVFKSKPTLGAQITEVVTYMVQEPLCIWVSMKTNLSNLLNHTFSTDHHKLKPPRPTSLIKVRLSKCIILQLLSCQLNFCLTYLLEIFSYKF